MKDILFKKYFDNFDFNDIPASVRDKDPEDFAEMNKLAGYIDFTDITEYIKSNYSVLYYCSPVENHNMILSNGIIPENAETIYTLTTNYKSLAFKEIMLNISKNKKKIDKNFNGKYYVYFIVVDKLDDVKLYNKDIKTIIYTKSSIPAKAIINYNEVQF